MNFVGQLSRICCCCWVVHRDSTSIMLLSNITQQSDRWAFKALKSLCLLHKYESLSMPDECCAGGHSHLASPAVAGRGRRRRRTPVRQRLGGGGLPRWHHHPTGRLRHTRWDGGKTCVRGVDWDRKSHQHLLYASSSPNSSSFLPFPLSTLFLSHVLGLKQLLDAQQLCDVTLLVEGKKFMCHRYARHLSWMSVLRASLFTVFSRRLKNT